MDLSFKRVSHFENGVASVTNLDGTMQYLDKFGRLIPGIYERTFQVHGEDFFPVVTKFGKVNYIDINGNKFFNEDRSIPQDEIRLFKEGFVSIHENDGYTFYNKDGKVVLKDLDRAGQFNEGIAIVKTKDGNWGMLDKNGELTSKSKWEDLSTFKEGFSIATDKSNRRYYVNSSGKRVSKKFKDANYFNDGVAVVKKENGKHYVINDKCKIIGGPYLNASTRDEGYTYVREENNICHYIDNTGKICSRDFNPDAGENANSRVHNGIYYHSSQGTKEVFLHFNKMNDSNYVSKPYLSILGFSEGLCPVQRIDGTWTCVDENLEELPLSFENSFRFKNGYAKITENKPNSYKKDFYFINANGKKVTGTFSEAYDFFEGYAGVCKNGSWHYLDHDTLKFLTDTPKNNPNKKVGSKSNIYGFNFDDITNEDLLKIYVESNASVFLHGPSGVGKSTRIKELDPTATRITLRPQMNPEEIDGTLDRDTGEFIPPLWYQQLTDKCEKEPDRKHILFIDELTNVKPTIQSLVYSIVLDRAGKDGLWPLPENSVVVAAGNESSNNLAAHPLTNALHRRFCHIYYDINKDNWFNWAIGSDATFEENTVKHTPSKNDDNIIHPAIVSFISNRGEDILSQELDEQNPKIVTDPRKWEIASDILYQTNNPYTLRPAIGPIAEDFAQYCKSSMLTPEDIINKNYNPEDFEDLNFGDRISTVAGLCNADQSDLSPVRQFIYDQFGKEVLSTYDSMWSNNDPIKEMIVKNATIEMDDNSDASIELE